VINLADNLRTARLQLLADALSGGTLTLYTAPKPAIGAAITTQTALIEVEIPLDLTAVDATLDLMLVGTAILADGEAVWGRMTSITDAFVLDGDCGLLASDALIKLKSTNLSAGANLLPILTTISEP